MKQQTINIILFKAKNSKLNNITIQGVLNISVEEQLLTYLSFNIIDFNLENCEQKELKSNVKINLNKEQIEESNQSKKITIKFNYQTDQLLPISQKVFDLKENQGCYRYPVSNILIDEQIIYIDNNYTDQELYYQFIIQTYNAYTIQFQVEHMKYSQLYSTYYNLFKYVKLIYKDNQIIAISCNQSQTYQNFGKSYQCYDNDDACKNNNTFLLFGQCIDDCSKTDIPYHIENKCIDECDWYEGFYKDENNQCVRCNHYLHNETAICDETECYNNETYKIDFIDERISYTSRLKKYYNTDHPNIICLQSCGNYTPLSGNSCIYGGCIYDKYYVYKETCYQYPQFGLFIQYPIQKVNNLITQCFYTSFQLYDMTCPASSYYGKLIKNQNLLSLSCNFNNLIQNNKENQCITQEDCLSCNTFKNYQLCDDCKENYVFNQNTQICDIWQYQDENQQNISKKDCTHQTGGDISSMCYQICHEKCPEDKGYYIKDILKCDDKCPNDYKYQNIDNRELQCLEQCPNKLVKNDGEYNKCIQQCENGDIIEQINTNTYKCIDNCQLFKQEIQLNDNTYQQCVDLCQDQFQIQEKKICVQQCGEYKFIYSFKVNNTQQYKCEKECNYSYIQNVTIYDYNTLECKEQCDYFLNKYECTDICSGYVLQFNNTCVDSCDDYFMASVYSKECKQNCDQFVQYNTSTKQYYCVYSCSYYQNYTTINNIQSTLCQNYCDDYYYSNRTCIETCYFVQYNNKQQCFEECEVSNNISDIKNQCIPICSKFTNIQHENYECVEQCTTIKYYDQYISQNVCIQCQQFYDICTLNITSQTTCLGQNSCIDSCQSSNILSDKGVYYCINDCLDYYQFYKVISINESEYNLCLESCENQDSYFLIQENQCVNQCSKDYNLYDYKCYKVCQQKYVLEDENLKQTCVDSCYEYNKTYQYSSNLCTNNCTYIIMMEKEYQCTDECEEYIKSFDYNDKSMYMCYIHCNNVVDGVQCRENCRNKQDYLFVKSLYLECQSNCEKYLIESEEHQEILCVSSCGYYDYQYIQDNYCVKECDKMYELQGNECKYQKDTTIYYVISFSVIIICLLIIIPITIQCIKAKKQKPIDQNTKEMYQNISSIPFTSKSSMISQQQTSTVPEISQDQSSYKLRTAVEQSNSSTQYQLFPYYNQQQTKNQNADQSQSSISFNPRKQMSESQQYSQDVSQNTSIQQNSQQSGQINMFNLFMHDNSKQQSSFYCSISSKDIPSDFSKLYNDKW